MTKKAFLGIICRRKIGFDSGGIVMNGKAKNISYAAIIAAIYTACSLLPGISAISYGPIQFRIAEALMLLCLLSPSAVVGVVVGCFLTNIFTPMGANMFDLVFGTGATLLAAVSTYLMRGFFKNHLWLSPLPTVIFNAVIVGSYLPLLMTDSFVAVWYCMLTVGIGEVVVCYILGLPLASMAEKRGFFKSHRR